MKQYPLYPWTPSVPPWWWWLDSFDSLVWFISDDIQNEIVLPKSDLLLYLLEILFATPSLLLTRPSPGINMRRQAGQMTKVLHVAWILTVSLFKVFAATLSGSLSVVLTWWEQSRLFCQYHYHCPPRYCSAHLDQDYKLEISSPCWASGGFHLHQLRQVSPSINLKHLVKYELLQSGLLSIQMESRDDQWLPDTRWIDILKFLD